MPRPPVKRRRQNSFNQKKRVEIPNQAQAREALAKRLAKKPLGKQAGDSEDSDNLVTTAHSGRARKRQEIYASGAVAKGDKPGAYPTRAQRTRTMRENTEEILSQRSRSVSRANSVASGTSTPVVQSSSEKENELEKAAGKDGRSAKKTKSDVTKPLVNGVKAVAHTPRADISVLGKIKPRKRQASILQLIENDNDYSSSINSDDEREFLPDEISTPVDRAQEKPVQSEANKSSSLKRKRGSAVPEAANHAQSSPSGRIVTSQPTADLKETQERLPQLTRSQRKRLSANHQDQDDVMAPPMSSDDEGSSAEQAVQPTRSTSRQQKAIAPSTEQLQSLMPSKKHQSRGQRKHDEFDIPEDSNSDVISEEGDVSTFMPSKRAAQKRQASKGKASQRSQTAKKGVRTKGKPQEQTKSTSKISYTPSPARLRTPRPLGSTQAKSPSKQGTNTTTTMREKSTNTPLATRSSKGNGGKKQYGGSRQRGTGKENQVVSLLDEPSGGDDGSEGNRDQGIVTKQHIESGEAKAWKKKWADIDDFALEFEDNTASTRSDSPTAR